MEVQNQLLSEKSILPNSSAILVLGILSIVCICCGPMMVVGFALGIIALVLGNKALNIYRQNPDMYSTASYKNAKSGRVCGIIGICLSGVWVLFLLFIYIFIGFAAACSLFPSVFG